MTINKNINVERGDVCGLGRPLFGARRRAVVVEWIRGVFVRWAERKTEVDAHRKTLRAMRRAGYMS